ncbi:MAG: hypothetical protein GKR93_12495 [Gammaproteobacteria bacterium]|nr:hypothetical protein [Gammaproteobacteria bacterium]
MKTSNYLIISLQAIAFICISQSALASDSDKRVDTEFYSARGDNVDADTFRGYVTYHQTCVRCHDVGGVGSEDIPDLTVSVDRLSPANFRIKVLHKFAVKFSSDDWTHLEQSMFEEIRKQEKRDNNELTNMPSWENNPIVAANVQNIYRYLKARADGAIGTEKPGLLKE